MSLRAFRWIPLGLVAWPAACRPAPPAATQMTPATGAPAQAFVSPPVLAGTPDVATLVTRVGPTVVNITTTHDVSVPSLDLSQLESDPFGAMWQFGVRRRGAETVLRQQELGSGFIVDAAGHVLTNAHVVKDAERVRIRLSDGRELEGKVRGRDERLDLAVLEVEGARELPVAAFGSSETLRVGEYVVAIGNPFGLGHTVTLGIVSAKSRELGTGPYDNFIQTDASINPGNSGGPLFDMLGRVVGINTAINPSGRGIGFAIPFDAAREVLPELIATGHVERGHLGLSFQQIDVALAKTLGLDRPKGALVTDVDAGGPADKAGLKIGDVVLSLDGVAVARASELPRLIALHRPGTTVAIMAVRDRVEHAYKARLDVLDDGPAGNEPAPAQPSPKSPGLGIVVLDAPGGGIMVDRVLPGSSAIGELEHGDVLLEINRVPVATPEDLGKQLQTAPRALPVLIKIKRAGQVQFVAIDRSLVAA